MSSTPNNKSKVFNKSKKKKNNKKGKNKTDNTIEVQRVPKYVKTDLNEYYGDYESNFKFSSDRVWLKNLKEVNNFIEKHIWLRTRVHSVRKKSNKMAFFVLRDQLTTVQGIIMENLKENIDREMVKYSSKIPPESIVDIFAETKKSEITIKSTTIHDIELRIKKIFVVSSSLPTLPFQLDDSSNKFNENTSDKQTITVTRKLRLDNRFIDLRANTSNAIFRIQSSVCKFFRDYLLNKNFIEIHTPKIVPGVSEGGAEVFKLDYFGQKACLAQSPQLYKQMAISSDMKKVFEIGSVFRAENANTHRHLTEFIGLDLEMQIYDGFQEIINICGKLFVFIFKNLNKFCSEEIEILKKSFQTKNLVFPEETVSITFKKAVELINEEKEKLLLNGKSEKEIEELGGFVEDNKDFSAPNEKLLGKIMKEKYLTDFYIVYKYPLEARPFYTMPDNDDNNYSLSFDAFIRGEEITSGAQRVHRFDLIQKRTKELGIEESLKDYLRSFEYGMPPHGGFGIGLERFVMLFMDLGNLRECSMFPRDPRRFSP